MKILYAIQATGNGHISRALQLTPTLQKLGDVDIFLSGSNASLSLPLPVKFRSKGISLFYNTEGAIDIKKIIQKNNWTSVRNQAKCLPVEKYDLVINDFEPITSKACRIKKKHSVQLSHQASFRSPHAPRPSQKSLIGESIFRWYATSTEYIGLHFRSYDDFILPPVIKAKYIHANPADLGHITIYHPSFDQRFFENQLFKLPELKFEVFLSGLQDIQIHKNITFYPVNDDLFSESMIDCHGIITGGGFETPAEAIFLNKKLMVIPLRNHYEQYCNAEALSRLGIKILHARHIGSFTQEITAWLNAQSISIPITPNNIEETIKLVCSKIEHPKEKFDQNQISPALELELNPLQLIDSFIGH